MTSSRGTTAYGAIMLALHRVDISIESASRGRANPRDFDGPIPAGAGAGGNLFDYLLCRKSCRYYHYVKDDRPRCVQPETHNISRPSIRSIVDVFHAEGFSTMRRFDSTFDTTDPHEAFKPPVDDADAPAEPETEREEAVDDAPAAPDEASSDP